MADYSGDAASSERGLLDAEDEGSYRSRHPRGERICPGARQVRD